jgi:Ser/Thr protein kinase RdoA (MazF antagonist)
MSLPDAGVAAAFLDPQDILDVEPWGGGHIHDSFRVTCRQGSCYLLQRINRAVFPRPRLVMENIVRVTSHVRARLQAEGVDAARLRRLSLELVPTHSGRWWHRHARSEWWRMYHFIPGAGGRGRGAAPPDLYQAGRVIGRFQQLLADLPAPPLHAVIPHFHDTPRRLQALARAVRSDRAGLAGGVRAELARVSEHQVQAGTLARLLAHGHLPWRVTHNDTKLDNILFDEQDGSGLCLVDLDTVMPGSALYDFGDAARGGVGTAAEDEPDLARVGIDPEKYAALREGYLSSAAGLLTPLEHELLALAPWTMAFEQGVRFLTDHLNGDVYYRVAYPGHNLARARAQFALADHFLAGM